MIEPRPINRATCPVCGRPDRRQPFTGNPHDQHCKASGMFVADAEKLGTS